MSTIKDIMTKNVVTLKANNTVLDAAKLMKERSLGCIVVVDGDDPLGIVTERDFVRRVIAEALPVTTEISDVMSKPIMVIDANASVREAARIMRDNKIRRLPVVEEEKLVGIVVASDLVRHLSKKTFTEKLSELILDALSRYPPDYPDYI